jgi:hypothetical protein
MKMKKCRKVFLTIIPVILLSACSRNGTAITNTQKLKNDVILEWNEISFRAFGGPTYQHSLLASRINAMVHIAMHDAVNAAQPVYSTYRFQGRDPIADPIVAAASAAYTVLLSELPSRQDFLDSALEASIGDIVNGDAKSRGLMLGRRAAESIISARTSDGSAGEWAKQVPLSSIPGIYQAVPPFNIQFATHWENVKLFALESKDQFRPGPHPALTSEAYAKAYNEVKDVGYKRSNSRTTEETFYAKFWYEFSEIGWNRITGNVSVTEKLDLFETARIFALVDMAMADAYTAGWDAKIHYNFWRPYSAIRAGAIDGNNATEADTSWEPAEPTPPIHDYPSTHSALGNAAATVLTKIIGDNIPFTMTSFTAQPAGSTRKFGGFLEAANENADSRVRAGIHFRFSCVAGQELGNRIGKWVVDHYLLPLK